MSRGLKRELGLVPLAAAVLPSFGPTSVARAFGRFWGFQVGWWSWLDSFVDVAVYARFGTPWIAVILSAALTGPAAYAALTRRRAVMRREVGA